jgi:putative transposase
LKIRRFAKGQRVVMGEREYVVEQSVPGGQLQLKDVVQNTCVTKPREELIDLLFNGHLWLLGDEQEESFAKEKIKKLLDADLTELPDDQRAETRKKCSYVTSLVDAGVDRKTKKVFQPLIDAIARSTEDKDPPHYWQLYRWYTDYMDSGENIRSFFPRRSLKGNGERKIQNEVIEITDQVIAERFLVREKVTELAIHDAVTARVRHENDLRKAAGNKDLLRYPDPSTIHRIIKGLDPYEVARARFGKRYADAKFMPKKEGVHPSRPLERVEMDHTKLDLFVVDLERRMPIGRPWMTLAIDVYTKCVLGIFIGFVPPSYHSVMQCLLHAISPKNYLREKFPSVEHTWDAYGLMENVVVDNGKEFHSEDFEDACLQLGIVVQYAPVKCPWYKPSAERFFGTLNTRLLHQQRGTSFSNIFEKDDYDSKKNAVISYEAFMEMIHKWIVDVYHRDKHKGLMNVPAEVWRIGVKEFEPALPESRKALEIMLGMVEWRTITASGIELHNLFYNDENLTALKRQKKDGIKKKVKIKYDDNDLSVIYVLDEAKKSYVPVKAISQGYTQGLNLWTHKVICRYAREQLELNYDVVNLALAKEEIWKMATAEWNLTKRTGSRQKLGRLFSVCQEDYGKIVESDHEVVSQPSALPALPYEALPPSAIHHPANSISDIGSVMNGEAAEETDKPAPEQAGAFLPEQPKKRRGRPKKEAKRVNQRSQAAASKAAAITTNPVAEDSYDLSEWGVSYVDISKGDKQDAA